MLLQDVIDEIKLEVYGGGILNQNLADAQLNSVVYKCIRELQRYYDQSKKVTVPYKDCIDLTGFDHIAILKIYRTEGYGSIASSDAMTDPVYAQQWLVFSNLGTMYNLQDYVLNYASWCTMSQIRNTLSTDLDFEEDQDAQKLYINTTSKPTLITIEYIPRITKVEEIKSDRWIDILIRMSVAMTKYTEGRILTKFKQSGALWENNGEALLQEGLEELKDLREKLDANDTLAAPID